MSEVIVYFPTIDGMIHFKRNSNMYQNIVNQDVIEQKSRADFLEGKNISYFNTLKESLEKNGFDVQILGEPNDFIGKIKSHKNSISETLKNLGFNQDQANAIWATNANKLIEQHLQEHLECKGIILAPKVAENEQTAKEIVDILLENNNVRVELLDTQNAPDVVFDRSREIGNTNFMNLTREKGIERINTQRERLGAIFPSIEEYVALKKRNSQLTSTKVELQQQIQSAQPQLG